jgi:hypothetical protein
MNVYHALLRKFFLAAKIVVTPRVKHVQEFRQISVYHAIRTNISLIIYIVSIVILHAQHVMDPQNMTA